jgi:serine/threonine protein kinase
MSELIGTRLGAYEILERIGGGGLAEVYLAKQKTAFDRQVAVKVIRKGYADDEDFRSRLLREAQVISYLSHPHILQLIEFGEGGENEELLYLVMPYVPGGTLRDHIKAHGGPLPLRETARIFSQLCEAVDYVHQHQLVHQSIRPSNVLMQDSRNILLSDFGIALDFGNPRLTVTHMSLGTTEYMAPEQARGHAEKCSDVYSLGVVLFVMLSGHAPYSGATPFDVLLRHASEPIPPLREAHPDVPAQIEQVMQTAMAKQPENRFKNAQALLHAFEEAQIQAGINMGAHAAPPAQHTKPKVFVSHSHRNDEFTARFVADLRAAGVEVWVDMSAIQSGDFMTRINEGLKACEWFVVVLTPAALESRPVEMEVNTAINLTWKDKMKGVIPFIAEACDPEKIPATWENLHRYDATSDYTKALAGLLHTLGLKE